MELAVDLAVGSKTGAAWSDLLEGRFWSEPEEDKILLTGSSDGFARLAVARSPEAVEARWHFLCSEPARLYRQEELY